MNKQKLLTGLILLLAFTCAKGQDKIITAQNDTISCRIISISPTHIQYEQKRDNQAVIGKFIPIEQVLEYYTHSKLQETPLGAFNSKRVAEPFRRWRIGIQGGGAYLLSSFDGLQTNMQQMGISQSKIDDYQKQLRNGKYVSADVHFLITRFFGVGLKYSLYAATTQLDYMINGYGYYYYTVSGWSTGYYIPTFYPFNEKDKIYLNYFGPSVLFQHWLDKNRKFSISEELSIGSARYREEGRLDPYLYINTDQGSTYLSSTLTEGNTLGGSAQVAFKYYPKPWLSVGANIGVFYTTFKTLKTSTKDTSSIQHLEDNDRLDMSRIDYSLGICFHF